MVNVFHRVCLQEGCNILPNFNFEGEKKGIYCKMHCKDGMINVRHSKCLQEGCKIQACFNFPGENYGIYCKMHSRDGMINVRQPARAEASCKVRPLYNFPGEKRGLYCRIHAKPKMVDVLNPICSSCGLVHVKSNSFQKLCFRCCVYLHPDRPNSMNYRTKEQSVTDHIKNVFSSQVWLFNRTVPSGNSTRRPDAWTETPNQVVVEIDENQHRLYDCSCENKRLMEISKDFNHKSIVFIRFNPDGYRDGKKIIPSCWKMGYGSRGLLVLENKKEWESRLRCLEEQINYWLVNNTSKTVEVIELFYDK